MLSLENIQKLNDFVTSSDIKPDDYERLYNRIIPNVGEDVDADRLFSSLEKGTLLPKDIISADKELLDTLLKPESLVTMSKGFCTSEDIADMGYETIALLQKQADEALDQGYYTKEDLSKKSASEILLLTNPAKTEFISEGKFDKDTLLSMDQSELSFIASNSYDMAMQCDVSHEDLKSFLKKDAKNALKVLDHPTMQNALGLNVLSPNEIRECTPNEIIEMLKGYEKSKAELLISSMPELNTSFGVEIELFREDPDDFPALPKGWRVEEDSSLEPKDQGMEVVSPILRNKDDLRTLVDVCTTSLWEDSYTNNSAGFHMHIGIVPEGEVVSENDKEAEEAFKPLERVKQILVNHAEIEFAGRKYPERDYDFPEFHKLIAEKQVENNPNESPIIEAKSLEDLLKITQVGGERTNSPVNLDSLFIHGTIEFRDNSPTISPMEMIARVVALNNVVGLADNILSEARDKPQDKGKARLLNDYDTERIQDFLTDLSEDDHQLVPSPDLLDTIIKKRKRDEDGRSTQWRDKVARKQTGTSNSLDLL